MADYINAETGDYSVSAYFGGKDTEGYRKYKEGKAQGKWKDLNDYIAKKPSTEEQFADNLIKEQQKLIKEQTSFLEQYTKNNPFVFDEELARQSATQEYEPYYQELLSDYVQNVEQQRTSIQDDRKLQQELKAFEEGAATRDLMRAVSQAEEGYAGAGMFFSGNKARAVGERQVESQIAGEKRDTLYNAGETARQRQEQGLDIEEQRRRRDIAREQESAIEGGILQRESEAIKQYNVPFVQAYNRRFDPGSISGYMVPEGLRY